MVASFGTSFARCTGLLLVVLAGCGSSEGSNADSSHDSTAESLDARCDAVSKCTGQPRGADTIARCEEDMRDPRCGRLAQDLWNCQVDNQTCGADGKTDLEKMREICLEKQGAWEWCALEGS